MPLKIIDELIRNGLNRSDHRQDMLQRVSVILCPLLRIVKTASLELADLGVLRRDRTYLMVDRRLLSGNPLPHHDERCTTSDRGT